MGSRDDVPPGAAGAVPGAELATRHELRAERRADERLAVVPRDQPRAEPADVPRDHGGAPRDASPPGESIGDPSSVPANKKIVELLDGTYDTQRTRFEPAPGFFAVGVDYGAPTEPGGASDQAVGFYTVAEFRLPSPDKIRTFVNGQERDDQGRPIETERHPTLTPEQKKELEERYFRVARRSMEYWIQQHRAYGEVGMTENMLMASNVALLLRRYDQQAQRILMLEAHIEKLSIDR